MRISYFISPISAALGAALFFGASTPFAKLFVSQISPILVAGLLYAGSGLGLCIIRLIRDKGWGPTGLKKDEWLWIGGGIFFGGIIGPLLLMLSNICI